VAIKLEMGRGSFHSSTKVDVNESGLGRALMSGTEKVNVRASLLVVLGKDVDDVFVDVDRVCTVLKCMHDTNSSNSVVSLFDKILIINKCHYYVVE